MARRKSWEVFGTPFVFMDSKSGQSIHVIDFRVYMSGHGVHFGAGVTKRPKEGLNVSKKLSCDFYLNRFVYDLKRS